MSRVIKFRFFSNAVGKYVSNNEDYAVCGNGDIYHLVDAYFEKFEPVKNEYMIKEQFTGLTDKNGVEIYDGDIVYCVTNDTFGRPEQEAAFVVEFDYGSFLAMTASEEQLVIGNIHQNPELIK